ncbi:helix-turn-helix domain-containing protein [Actinocrispum wychmicini]|uniref:Transcriptional regulator with XRE-family HTH domain n=1 Tax=Actinocrispum wychmicini TaxID=1213861 RepID=A0A4R2JX20_9PSEU|nr:helix-turn-helix transcriptional regulator [Actinocrispum wychmicini]TCO64404.1 transcriptional regulator with XRE-family HTH domain [Actinocrispum wychmicini]
MPAEDQQPDGIGRRVKAARQLAGWTQDKLAREAHVSLSLVKQVEQGRVPASPAFTDAVAVALKSSSTKLKGQPYEDDSRPSHRVHSGIAALRREVASYRLPPEDTPPRSLARLTAAVADVSRLRHRAKLDKLGDELPTLLAELRAATHHTKSPDRERLFGLLAEAYAAAGQVAYKLGYADLSALTTERVEWAARQSGDPLAGAAADFYIAGELIVNAEWRGALNYLEQARHQIEDELRTVDNEAALAMHGVLHLKSGLAAARAGDADAADAHLAEARDAAQWVTPGSDHYRLAFDIDSVNIWSVGLAVERQDGTEAVKRAQGLRFNRTAPRERVGHHWIDLARAYQLHGDRDRALATLLRAKRTAPQQMRYHPQVRETLVTLAEHDRRRSDTLAGLASWAGIRL